MAAKSTNFSLTGSINGTPVTTGTGTEYFQVNPYRYLGTVYDDGSYEVGANQVNLPATASIGASGNLYTSITYAGNTKAAVIENNDSKWSLERDAASRANAYLCTKLVSSSDPDETSSTCLRINEAGTISSVKFVYTESDGTTYTYQ